MFDEVRRLLKNDPVDSLTRQQLDSRVGEIKRLKAAVAGYEARVVRAVDALDDQGIDGAGMLRSTGKASSKAAARTAETAAMLAELPETQEALEDGRITAEHADAVATAARKVSPAQAEQELLGAAEDQPADLFAKTSREWTTKNTPDDGTDEHDRQRRNRTLNKTTKDGMDVLIAELDRVTANTIWKAICERARQLWLDDGGRTGGPADQRTPGQRRVDALVELITGARRRTPIHPRHQLNVNLDISGMTDSEGRPLASLVVDGKPLPAAVLERIVCTANITPMLFDGPSRPLWVGRDHRSATIAQWRALIARDRGCVGCGAGVDRCEAHHIRPWKDFGDTDIDNLVLVCARCHHDVHDRGLVLRRSNGRWHIVNRAGPDSMPEGYRNRDIDNRLDLFA